MHGILCTAAGAAQRMSRISRRKVRRGREWAVVLALFWLLLLLLLGLLSLLLLFPIVVFYCCSLLLFPMVVPYGCSSCSIRVLCRELHARSSPDTHMAVASSNQTAKMHEITQRIADGRRQCCRDKQTCWPGTWHMV